MGSPELNLVQPHPFYKTYIDILGDVELLDMLQRQLGNFPEFIESIPDDKLGFSYQPEKWTTAQVLQHIIDTERIFQHRAFRFSRGDTSVLPGFDQDSYAEKSMAERRSKESIIEEYKIVRKSTISLFANLDRNALENTGIASDVTWSVAALGFVICGHQKHHRDIIRERYI
ncbi:MAG TPA: DinB family protein [Pricia sp.]|nr:DinB family protein [Pricia sp.]